MNKTREFALNRLLEICEELGGRHSAEVADIRAVLARNGTTHLPAVQRKGKRQPQPAKKKRRMSAEAKKRIGDAARRRWAAYNKAKAAAAKKSDK